MLGPLEILVDGAPAPPRLRWRKHAALLIYLALGGPRPHPRSRLTALLWPDKPEAGARHSLNEAARVIRRTAGPEALVSGVDDLRLQPGHVQADTDELLQLGSAGVERAAALIRGRFLDGFMVEESSEFEQWLDGERQTWHQRMRAVLLAASHEARQRGHAAPAADLARRAMTLDPASELAIQRLMEALALAGDRAGALAAHADLERTLRELGAEPGAAVRRLAGLIRAGTLRTTERRALAEAPRHLPLVERGAQLAALTGCWDRARAEHRSALLLVTGRDGCGRSRLAAEVARQARVDGAAVAVARGVPADATSECAGLLALARGGLLKAPGIGGGTAQAVGTFAALLPEWQDRFPAVPAVPGDLPQAFAEVVRAAATAGPVMLMHDDVQWSDPRSLDAELALLRDCAELPLALLLTQRPDDECPAVDRARAHIGRDWLGVVAEAEPLTVTGLASLVEDRFPGWAPDGRDRLARRLRADSAGQPALVVELLSAIAAGLPADATEWPAIARTLDATFPADQPDVITAAVRVNFGCLAASERNVLGAVAVLGSRVGVTQLQTALQLPAEDIIATLDRLEAQCWLDSDARGYFFQARAVQTVIERDFVTRGARRRIRQRAGLDPPA
jgi:DNA-binding SARP family transcriptional activator